MKTNLKKPKARQSEANIKHCLGGEVFTEKRASKHNWFVVTYTRCGCTGIMEGIITRWRAGGPKWWLATHRKENMFQGNTKTPNASHGFKVRQVAICRRQVPQYVTTLLLNMKLGWKAGVLDSWLEANGVPWPSHSVICSSGLSKTIAHLQSASAFSQLRRTHSFANSFCLV